MLKAKLAGMEFELPLKYKFNDKIELSALEAEILNAAQIEFVVKRFKKYADAQKALGLLDLEALEVRLLATMLDVNFTEINDEGNSLAFLKMCLPVVKAAHKIALAHVKDAISRQGWKLSQVSKENLEALVQEKLQENDLYWHKAVEMVEPLKRLSPVSYEPAPAPALEFNDDGGTKIDNSALELKVGGLAPEAEKKTEETPVAPKLPLITLEEDFDNDGPTDYEGPNEPPANRIESDGFTRPHVALRIPPRGSGG